MLKYLLQGALCLFWVSIATAQTDAYYWADGNRIALTASQTHFIVTADEAVTLENLKPAGTSNYTNWPHKPYAVMEMNGPMTRPQVLAQLGRGASAVQVSPGYELADGFVIYPTQTVVAQLNDGVSKQAMMDVIDGYGVKQVTAKYGTYRIEMDDVRQTMAAANQLQESGLFRFAQPDFYAPIERYQVSDPLFGEQFQMNNTGQTIDGVTGANDADCNALEAWNISIGSAQTTVAVIDDGMEDHEDFNNASGQSRYTAGFSPANNGNGDAVFGSNHGVSCAGSIAASHNNIGVRGLAPLANMISVNIFIGGESTQDLADGFTWAKDQGADVMSNSWGYTSCELDFSNINSAMADANANGRGGLGCVIVFASGNGSKGCVDYPARNPNVIAVGAFANTGIRSDYSNFGSALDIMAPSNNSRGVPGAGVRTTDRMGGPGYVGGNYFNGFGGTSSACPVVAGVATLLLGYAPNLNSNEVKEILYSTAIDMGPAGDDLEYANGRVNALGALQAVDGGGGDPDPGVGQPTNVQVRNEQDTQLDLTWDTPAGGNVSTYEILLDGRVIGAVGGNAATVTGLVACTTYEFGVRAVGNSGDTSGATTTTGSTTGCADSGGTPFTVGYSFEADYEGWGDGGNDCTRVTTQFSWDGNISVRLRDDNGTISSMTSPAYNLAGLASAEIEFFFYSNSMEFGENFFVSYNDGSGWQTIANYSSGNGFENDQFYVAGITLNAGEFNLTDGARFRIQCDASDANDEIFIDAVTVTGSQTAGASFSPVVTIEALGGLQRADYSPVSAAAVSFFPNPASDLVTIQAADAIDQVAVFNMQGEQVLLQQYTDVERASLNIGNLAPGAYIISAQTGKERHTERLIIQR